MDERDVSDRAAELLAEWRTPVWIYRSGRLTQLVGWCTAQAKKEARAEGCDETFLGARLWTGLTFATDFHDALNPAGARLLLEGPPPSRELEGGKPHFTWFRTVGTVWNHDSPVDRLPKWQAAFARKELVRFPVTCNVELVAGVLDAYVKLPSMHHPWLEWCMLDALVRAETIGIADHANLLAADVPSPSHSRRGRWSRWLSAAADGRSAREASERAAPYGVMFAAMVDTYDCLCGAGWTTSPTRVRETMAAAERVGVRWSPACYVLIDRAMLRDPSTWNFEPP